MTNSIILVPGMLKRLRLARLYGFLVERKDGLYHRAAVNHRARWNWHAIWLKAAGW
ncbi:hypothetical protein ACVIIW_006233 [Bradyrhizobium sp. USDA 4449]